MTHHYNRNDAMPLFAVMNVLDGTMISQCQSRHRHQEWLEFLRLIESRVASNQPIHLICDNYATHKHATVQAGTGAICGSMSTSRRRARPG